MWAHITITTIQHRLSNLGYSLLTYACIYSTEQHCTNASMIFSFSNVKNSVELLIFWTNPLLQEAVWHDLNCYIFVNIIEFFPFLYLNKYSSIEGPVKYNRSPRSLLLAEHIWMQFAANQSDKWIVRSARKILKIYSNDWYIRNLLQKYVL